ncbi:MAG: hypothetical protein ABIF10_01570 [Candidatus Woesearchaeota archaeon]
MKVLKFRSGKEAEDRIMVPDKDYVSVRHVFPKNLVVGLHFHPYAYEWAIMDKGGYEFSVDFQKSIIKPNGSALVVCLPPARVHGLKCLEDVTYDVLRSVPDAIVNLNSLLQSRSSIRPKISNHGKVWHLYDAPSVSVYFVELVGGEMHKHPNTSQMYRIKGGSAELVADEEIFQVRKGDVIDIPKNFCYMLTPRSGKPLESLILTYPKYDPTDYRKVRQ